MRDVWKVIGFNLLGLLAYSGLIHLGLLVLGEDTQLGLVYSVITSWVHLALCVIAAIVFFILRKPSIGSGFLLAALFVGMIGFSMCVGVFASNY